MRYPKPLTDGGTIGFVAPSFGASIEPYKSAFQNALEHFHAMGYRTKLGPNCYASDGIGISTKPALCGKELNDMYKDPETDVLMACGGGELMCEVVPHIDWDLIRKCEPKWYLGYSDNTNFTFLSTIMADTAAIYGPCAPSFGMEPMGESLSDALAVLRGETRVHNYPKWEKESLKDEEHPTVPYNLTEEYRQRIFVAEQPLAKTEDPAVPTAMREIDSVSLKGRLLGGCADILSVLCGTRYDRVGDFLERYREDGFIWFLECCDLNPLSVRRMLFQLKEAGWFRYVKGFLFGRPLHFGEEMMGLDMVSAVTGCLGELGVPILMDLDFGHLPPQMPLISGAIAKVNAADNCLMIEHILR